MAEEGEYDDGCYLDDVSMLAAGEYHVIGAVKMYEDGEPKSMLFCLDTTPAISVNAPLSYESEFYKKRCGFDGEVYLTKTVDAEGEAHYAFRRQGKER